MSLKFNLVVGVVVVSELILYQVNHALGGYGFIILFLVLFIFFFRRAVGPPIIPSQTLESTRTFPLEVILNGLVLWVNLIVKVGGSKREELLVQFCDKESWNAVIRWNMRDWREPDKHKTVKAIQEIVSMRAGQFNSQVIGRSYLNVVVEILDGDYEPIIDIQSIGTILPI